MRIHTLPRWGMHHRACYLQLTCMWVNMHAFNFNRDAVQQDMPRIMMFIIMNE